MKGVNGLKECMEGKIGGRKEWKERMDEKIAWKEGVEGRRSLSCLSEVRRCLGSSLGFC